MVVAVPTFQDGVMVDAAELNALVANVENLYNITQGGTSGIYVVEQPRCVLRMTATRSCGSANTESACIWDVADVNNNAMWASGATVTVQTGGTYRVTAQVGTNGSIGDGGALYIVANGTVTSTNAIGCWRDDYCTSSRVSALFSLTVGTTIEVIYEPFVASRNFLLVNGGCRFEIVRIGPA